jgi:hypothetical protein
MRTERRAVYRQPPHTRFRLRWYILLLFAAASISGVVAIGASLAFEPALTRTVHLPEPLDPITVAAGENGGIYVGCLGTETVMEMDMESGRVVRQVTLKGPVAALAHDPQRKRLLVTNGTDGILRILSLPDLRVLHKVSIGRGLAGIALSEHADLYYICDLTAKKLLVVDPVGLRVVRDVDMHSPPLSITPTAQTSVYAVGCASTEEKGASSSEIAFINVNTYCSIISTALRGENIVDLAPTAGTPGVYALVGAPGTLYEVTMAPSGIVTRTIASGFSGAAGDPGDAYGMAVHHDWAYITGPGHLRLEQLVKINVKTGEIGFMLGLGSGHARVISWPHGRHTLAVPGFRTGTVSFLPLSD